MSFPSEDERGQSTAIIPLKIVILGDNFVGKSSLMACFLERSFEKNGIISTVGVDFRITNMNIDGNRVKLTIFDTASQDRFRACRSSCCRGVHGVICVYDVTSRESFECLDHWMAEAETYSTKGDMIKMLVANKFDKPNREVTQGEGEELARRHRALFIEASAKTNEGVQCAFEQLIGKIIQTPGLWENDRPAIRLEQSKSNQQQNGYCGY